MAGQTFVTKSRTIIRIILQLKYVIPQVIQSRKLALKRIKKTERERMRRLERQPRVRREANRVIGGFDVVDNSWQFMVDIGGLCGGSLISNRLVLTAAHCCQKASFDYMTMRIGIRLVIYKNGVPKTLISGA